MSTERARTRPLRVGLLKADSVRPQHLEIAGDYDAMFEKLLRDCDPPIAWTVYDVVAGELPEATDACDAYVITGSKWSAYDPDPWIEALSDFIRRCDAAGRRLVGVCFGHQLVAQALGGRVERAPQGWGQGVHGFEVVADAPWMDPPLDACRLGFSHQDQVVALPPGARLLARNGFCPVQMYAVADRILAVQGHPEFPTEYLRALIEMRRERLGPQRTEEALASLATPTSRETVARWIARFLRGD